MNAPRIWVVEELDLEDGPDWFPLDGWGVHIKRSEANEAATGRRGYLREVMRSKECKVRVAEYRRVEPKGRAKR